MTKHGVKAPDYELPEIYAGRRTAKDVLEMAESETSQQEIPPPDDPRISKVPTGLGAEPLNIIILGASFAGLACAHHFLDHTINRLRVASSAPNYRLIIVSPSTHLYWNIGAPRVLVGENVIKQEEVFIPISSGFHWHRVQPRHSTCKMVDICVYDVPDQLAAIAAAAEEDCGGGGSRQGQGPGDPDVGSRPAHTVHRLRGAQRCRRIIVCRHGG